MVEAPAPSRPIAGSYAGPGLLAHVLVSKYADHVLHHRLLTRMLTQIERIRSINETEVVSLAIVEAARDSLVIG